MTSKGQTVTLIREVRPDIEIHLTAEFRDDGSLVLEGHDLGPRVAEFWPSDEYEYWLTIDAPHIERLLQALLADRADDLSSLAGILDRLDVDYHASTDRRELVGPPLVVTTEKPDTHGKGAAFRLNAPQAHSLVLSLLHDAYASGQFTGTSDLQRWLIERDIPSGLHNWG